MARRDYSQMYKSYEEKEREVPVEKEIVEEKKEEAKTFFNGTVIGGKNLNVREKPDGNVIDSLPNGTTIQIMEDSNPEWYKVKEPKGYVMRKFIKKED